jgi:hypothetical protein
VQAHPQKRKQLQASPWPTQHIHHADQLTWLATAGFPASAWYQVHKAPQSIQCLQPLLPQRWVLPQMAAVVQRHKDAVRGNLTYCHCRLCSFKRLFNSCGCVQKRTTADSKSATTSDSKSAALAVSAL